MVDRRSGFGFALVSALLFGLVSVAAKSSTLHPLIQGGAAYFLAGILLSPTLRGLTIARADVWRVATMALVGGALAPALLFFGLQHASAVSASLLLTLEMVFTAILATIVLRERTRGGALVGLVLLFAAALVVAASARDDSTHTSALGVGLVAAAALGWGVDNAVSARLVGSYRPTQLIAVKGLVGGAAALVVAAALRAPVEITWSNARAVLFIGALGIGASTVLFYRALQRAGATITSALFLPASALVGVVGAALVLREPLTWHHALAGALVIAGAWQLFATRGAPREV